VQMVLGPHRPYRGARTKMASAAVVAVVPITPNLFQSRPNWDRSTLVSPDTRIDPSPSSVIVTGRGNGRGGALDGEAGPQVSGMPLVGCTAVANDADLREALDIEEVG
jgi:hypothetical protein